MLRRMAALLVVGILALVIPATAHENAPASTKSGKATQTATTARRTRKAARPALFTVKSSSPKAQDLYQRAVQDHELQYLQRGLIGWRAAAKEDPNFTAAWVMVAMNSHDPEEMRSAREHAKSLLPKSSPGEKLLVQWIAGVQEGNDLAGIAAMNDLLSMFPRDKHLQFMAADWLIGLKGEEHAHRLLHKALDVDPDFPPALNDLAYLHGRHHEFGEALLYMDRYAALLPNEPNPQDSYGEISRMAGRFDESLEHYRAALKIDASFNTSQIGLGDTYALMGDEQQARQEYDQAIKNEADPADRFEIRMQKATSWVREKNYIEADRELWRIAQEAHVQSFELQEAQALRRMAQYSGDDKQALERLFSAEDALEHRHNLSASDRDPELAQILRIRSARAMRAGMIDYAQAALTQLTEMATRSRNEVIQHAAHGATGEMLLAQGKLSEAIAELEEDRDDPETIALLVKAYQQAGATEKSKNAEEQLRATLIPTLEQALSVNMVRAKAAEIAPPAPASSVAADIPDPDQ